MRILATALSVTLLSTSVPGVAASQAPQAPPPPQPCTAVEGLFVGRDRNNEGIGMWLEFAPDGSVVRAQGRIVDGGYQINGGTLMLFGNVSVAGKGGALFPGKLTQKVTFKITGAEMTRRAEQASVEAASDSPLPPSGRGGAPAVPMAVPPIADLAETKLTRVREGSGDPLSGVWTWTSKSGRPVLERFSGRGRYAMLEPMGGQKGTYTLESGKLSVTADGATSAVNTTCAGPWLNIETPNGPMRFLKFQ